MSKTTEKKTKEKDNKVQIPARIHKSILDNLKDEVKYENERLSAEGLPKTNLGKIIEYRLQHFESTLTPAILAKMQNITNTAVDVLKDNDPEKAADLQTEVDALWKSLE